MPVFNNALAGAAGSAGGAAAYEIERSLRFNNDDSAYLNRTPSSAGNRKTFTFSAWVKKTSTGSTFAMLGSGTDTTNLDALDFNGEQLRYTRSTSGSFLDVKTNATFRDPSAWYHVVLAVDTTQSTASNRVKIYVNGVQETSLAASNYPSQNEDTFINSTEPQVIGRRSAHQDNYFDGYMADAYLVDGSQLDHTSFGEYDDNNVWQPKAYSGTYGTNGFHLDFSDNSSNAALGYDAAGSNNWTVNNLVAQGPTATQFKVYGNASTSGSSSTINVSSLTTLQGTNVSTYNIGGTNYNHLTADLGSVGTHAIQARTYLNVGSDILVFVSNNGSSWSSISNQQDPYIFTGRYIQWVRTSQGYDNQVLTAVSAESATDSLLDSPTNYEADSGNNGGNYATLNASNHIGNGTLSNGNLDVAGGTGTYHGFSTIGVSSGKWYAEIDCLSGGGASNIEIGIVDLEQLGTNTTQVFDAFSRGFGYRNDANKITNNGATSYGATYSSGDVIGMAADLDNGTLTFYKNGSSQGTAFTGIPSGYTYHFATFVRNSSDKVAYNFGQRPFSISSVPTGFK